MIAIIPARYASSRLPGKMLLPIAGKPLILHTLEQATRARNVSLVLVATDDERIYSVVTKNGGSAVMTSTEHRSGSDRVAEVAEKMPVGSIIVNVQGDEPAISPRTIELAVEALIADEQADMSTTCEAITEYGQLINPNVVKVVISDQGYAIYFSRSAVPYPREMVNKYGSLLQAFASKPKMLSRFRKHTGIYVYRRDYLLKFAGMKQSKLEQIEMLEQLRALETGAKIKVVEINESSIGVDTTEDFERVREVLEGR